MTHRSPLSRGRNKIYPNKKIAFEYVKKVNNFDIKFIKLVAILIAHSLDILAAFNKAFSYFNGIFK